MKNWRRGLVFWHNAALVSFAVIAVALTWTVVNSGFSTSEVVKDVVGASITESEKKIHILGKITAGADLSDNQLTVTATPITTTTFVDTTPQNMKIAYKIIKDGSHEITHNNIYSGALYGRTFNSLNDALDAAKREKIITANPLLHEKSDNTVAFLYWVLDQNFDQNIDANEVVNIVIVYSDGERPTTNEYLKMQIIENGAILLDVEKNVPNISGSIIGFGGKIKSRS
jgi:flagellin FlaB